MLILNGDNEKMSDSRPFKGTNPTAVLSETLDHGDVRHGRATCLGPLVAQLDFSTCIILSRRAGEIH